MLKMLRFGKHGILSGGTIRFGGYGKSTVRNTVCIKNKKYKIGKIGLCCQCGCRFGCKAIVNEPNQYSLKRYKVSKYKKVKVDKTDD